MAQFSINDLAELSGIKKHTIRIWEHRYNFLNPERFPSTRRTYTAEELNVLLDVVLIKQNGYKVSSINKMSLDQKLEIVSQINDHHQKAVHELIINMAKMDAREFEAVLTNCVYSWGIHTTIQQILLPFSDTVGLLQNGNPRNYLENIILVKQLIKQKIYNGIELAGADVVSNKKVLIFLPPGELQELTLLYLHYLLKMNGVYTINLGPQSSTTHIQMICRRIKPDFIITHSSRKTNTGNVKELKSFAEKISESLNTTFVTIEHPLTTREHTHNKHAASISEALDIVLNSQ